MLYDLGPYIFTIDIREGFYSVILSLMIYYEKSFIVH